jgi:pimeloyl-ACP methyl ester carboxylesterase
MTEQTVKVGDQEIAYLESDGEGRAVIFVHGNSCSARTWRPLLNGSFGRRFRSLAFDLPGHGRSAAAADPRDYSLPGYAAILTGFADAVGARDAVIVGWSLGGHVALEAASAMPDAAGFVIFGTPPVAVAAQLGEAFLPNPATGIGFSAAVSEDEARTFAGVFTAPGSTLPLDDFVADILATDGTARASMIASVGEGRFADELEIVQSLRQPLAILHGEGEQLISLDYLRQVPAAGLWRGQVQLITGAGHAPHQETPEQFATLLEQFISDLG